MDDELGPDPIDKLAKAQEALRQAEHDSALYRMFFERSDRAGVFINSTGIITSANRAAELVFGFPAGAMVGQPVHVCLPERLRTKHAAHIARAMRNPKDRSMGVNMKLVGFNQSGYEFPVEVELIFYRAPGGGSLFASGTVRVLDDEPV